MTDMINPAHYRGDRKFEPIEVIEDWGLNYRLGNALKYISRNGRKPGEDPREGLCKAIWYLEREIESLDKPSQYTPPADVQYEDVLEYYGQSIDLDEAWPEYHSPTPTIKNDDGIIGGSGDDILSLWEETPDYVTGWDPSLGPVEISSEEVKYILSLKDVNQFDDDEIVSIVERRGMIIGFRKDGTSCVLKDGRCE